MKLPNGNDNVFFQNKRARYARADELDELYYSSIVLLYQ